jgi:hypothetical protein
MEAVTESPREGLIRSMKDSIERQPRLRRRGCTCGQEEDDALQVIAASTDYICPDRLTPNLTQQTNPSLKKDSERVQDAVAARPITTLKRRRHVR